MQAEEFNSEMGALLRSLSSKIMAEPQLQHTFDVDDVAPHLDRAIVALVALRLALSKK